MSIVAVPCLRFAQAARWNGQAPQSTTGVARLSASHCQLSNCSAGIIDIEQHRQRQDAPTRMSRRAQRRGSSVAPSAALAGLPAEGSDGLVAGGLDRLDELVRRDRAGVELDASPSRWRS